MLAPVGPYKKQQDGPKERARERNAGCRFAAECRQQDQQEQRITGQEAGREDAEAFLEFLIVGQEVGEGDERERCEQRPERNAECRKCSGKEVVHKQQGDIDKQDESGQPIQNHKKAPFSCVGSARRYARPAERFRPARNIIGSTAALARLGQIRRPIGEDDFHQFVRGFLRRHHKAAFDPGHQIPDRAPAREDGEILVAENMIELAGKAARQFVDAAGVGKFLAVERTVAENMAADLQVDRLRVRRFGINLKKPSVQLAAHRFHQFVFIGEMQVERGAGDAGIGDDVLDRHGLEILFRQQMDERFGDGLFRCYHLCHLVGQNHGKCLVLFTEITLTLIIVDYRGNCS